MDTEKFRFSTRIQKLNSMEGSTRTVVNYLDQLEQFHQQQGSSFTRVPMLDKKPLDLHQLKKEVAARGGYDGVTRGKKWSEVGKILGADPKSTSGFYTCRNAYMKWIHPFEEYLASMGKSEPEPAPFYDQNAHTPQPEIKPPPFQRIKAGCLPTLHQNRPRMRTWEFERLNPHPNQPIPLHLGNVDGQRRNLTNPPKRYRKRPVAWNLTDASCVGL
ncbi:ARID DNA-binding domain-containing protein [Chytridium lagenaria]|nr:ARID DNA-binding domain-containing protein [Chytridium lagenaria]